VYSSVAVVSIGLRVTLSTANNSESDAELTTIQTIETPIVAANGILRYISQNEKVLTLTSKATHYLNIYVGTVTAGDVIGFIGAIKPSVIQAICAYL